ncbi:MAG TPA: glycine--tRNA ligase subunit beta, partial [Stellaceae bacterium]|nr:glycine--tRNA ligase subunit beta [Stellaceae bacterium]
RLAVIADDIPARQPDRREERRGPRVGAPQAALDGFLRAAGLSSIEQCELRDTGRGEFYFAIVERPGRAAAEVLPELLRAAIGELPWPKSMRYPASGLRWVRPLVSAICLYDGAVLPLPLDHVPVGRTTRGHRFLSQGEIAIENAADYLAKVKAAQVVLDHNERRRIIEAELDRLAAAEGLKVKPDPALLDEVTGLVEFPVVLMGRIDEASMELPPEVLATAMRTHQKYFSCLNAEPAPANAGGTTAPRFLFVANNRTADGGAAIVAGNERVLRARLADARFFWDQDRKMRLEDRVEALKQRVYYDKLGTMYDKAERLKKLAGWLAEQLYPPVTPESGNDGAELSRLAQRAAHLAKADLSTGMVGEFPELQGVMGRYYALNDGEDPRAADAIADHYKPQGPNDTCPTAPIGIAVSLADKLDALAAFFSIGEAPTGSRDPFALRRAALGVIRLVLENGLRLDLREVFSEAELCLQMQRIEDVLSGEAPRPPEQPVPIDDLVAFVADRLRVHLRDQGARHDLVAAVFRLNEHDLVRLLARVSALGKFLASEDGADLLVAYRRASKIVRIEAGKGGWTMADPELGVMRQPEEIALAQLLTEVAVDTGDALQREEFDAAMAALATLRRPVDEFFDKVTVNADDPRLRENRLRLLSRIRAVMNQVADFSQIEG